MRWWSSVVSHSKINGNLIDIETKSLGQTIHAVILIGGVVLRRLVFTSHISVLLVNQILESISEPSLGVSSEFIGILGLQDLSGKSHWRLNILITVSNFFLELVVFLLGVPVPFVNLLELKTSILGKLFELGFCWFTVGILIALLELIDLVSALPGSLKANEGRSILFLVNNFLFRRFSLGQFKLFSVVGGILLLFTWCFLGTHDSFWHENGRSGLDGLRLRTRLLLLKVGEGYALLFGLVVPNSGCWVIKDILQVIDLNLFIHYLVFLGCGIICRFNDFCIPLFRLVTNGLLNYFEDVLVVFLGALNFLFLHVLLSRFILEEGILLGGLSVLSASCLSSRSVHVFCSNAISVLFNLLYVWELCIKYLDSSKITI